MLTYMKQLHRMNHNPRYFRLFKHFLVTKKIYKQFINNVINSTSHPTVSDLIDPTTWLYYAFTWDHTPEGGDLWVNVNYYWIKTVRAFNKQYQQEYVFTF